MPLSIERQLVSTIAIVALLAVLSALGLMFWTVKEQNDSATEANAVADALSSAITEGAAPKPLLETFAAAGSIRAATYYGPGGAAVASVGNPSPNVEQIFRSLPGGGSLSVEGRRPVGGSLREVSTTAAIAGAVAALIAIIASVVLRSSFRRRIDRLRMRIEEATYDQTYATRVDAEAGALQSVTGSVNRLLDQTQKRDVSLRRKMTDLEEANKDLQAFTSTVSHDLRAPIGSIAGFAQALDEGYGPDLDDTARECIHWIRHSSTQMMALVEAMLQMARLARVEIHRTAVDISAIAVEIAGGLQRASPDRKVEFVIERGLITNGDEKLLQAVLDNLIGNAFKFTGRRSGARIEVGSQSEDGAQAFFVRDNGAGFDAEHAARMFRPFQRLHSEKEFKGTGIGLATVHRIVQRHGGRVWAEGERDKGATVYFTTGSPEEEWVA